jgi:hypothetical protein
MILESVESSTLKWLESDNTYSVGFNTSVLEDTSHAHKRRTLKELSAVPIRALSC